VKIEFQNVEYSYPSSGRDVRSVLNGVTFAVNQGECIGIMGEEGAGKTTLAHLLVGLLSPRAGRVFLDGIDVGAHLKELAGIRKQIGFAFQLPEQYFIGETVEWELEFAAQHGRGSWGYGSPGAALTGVGLQPEQYLSRSPHSLSMGEARRVALAALLLRNPALAILDEPTVGLDGAGTMQVLDALQTLRSRGTTIIVISHDVDFLTEIVERIIILGGGVIQIDGSADTILHDENILTQFGYQLPEVVRMMNEVSPDVPLRNIRSVSAARNWLVGRRSS
jgi:energy-coupling factor transporter ATP-binding protein EcfA2